MNRDSSWGTEAELEFLENLGTYLPSSLTTPRSTWLRRYRDTMALREQWGKINRGVVEGHVDALIFQEPHGS